MTRNSTRLGTQGRYLELALAPLRTDSPPRQMPALLQQPPAGFVQWLDWEGLAPLWSDWITAADWGPGLAPKLSAQLRGYRQAEIARYLLQRHATSQICRRLSAAGIRCAVFKGVAVRERLYADPSLRPAEDLDILLAPEQLASAIRLLTRTGFSLHPQRFNVSHETTLCDGHTTLDLHWRICRPGRSRIDLSPQLLATISEQEPFPVFSDAANLLVMLTHPAFAKHVNGCGGKLIRALDLDRMLRSGTPDWGWILPLLAAAGLRTAAWAVLHWQRTLMDTPVDAAVLRHLEPGRLQRRYLRYWIDHQLPSRLDRIPGLIQGAFSLALHERPADVLHAIVELGRARLQSGSRLRDLQRISRTLD